MELYELIEKKQASRDKLKNDVEDIEGRIDRLQKKLDEKRTAVDLRSTELERLLEIQTERRGALDEILKLEAEGHSLVLDDIPHERLQYLYTLISGGAEALARKVYYNR